MVNKKQATKHAKKQDQKMIGFVAAVKNFFAGYLDFRGTATRAEYWWTFLAIIIGFVLYMAFMAIAGVVISTALLAPLVILMWLIVLGLILPAVALMCRRIHDAGFSAWIYYGPALACIALELIGAAVIEVAGGNILSSVMIWCGVIGDWVMGIFAFVLTLLPSKIKDNKYRI